MDAVVMKRLAFIKYLYNNGVHQSKQPPPLSSASILSFHDAAELFLHLALQHLDASKNVKDFMSYWEPINNKLSPKTITQKEPMRRLNNARIQLKHYGTDPSALDIEDFKTRVMQFFNENTLTVFDITFDSISLIDLVQDQDVKDMLHNAQKLMGKNDFPECLKEIGRGFGMLVNNYERQKVDKFGLSPFFFGQDLTFESSFIMDIQGKMGDFVDKVSESITSIQDAIKVLSLGFDYRKYSQFKRIIPIIQIINGTVHVVLSSDYAFTKEDCMFCFEFVIECALKLQEFDFKVSLDGGIDM